MGGRQRPAQGVRRVLPPGLTVPIGARERGRRRQHARQPESSACTINAHTAVCVSLDAAHLYRAPMLLQRAWRRCRSGTCGRALSALAAPAPEVAEPASARGQQRQDAAAADDPAASVLSEPAALPQVLAGGTCCLQGMTMHIC